MKAREGPLNLDKNLNKVMIVSGTGRGPGQPGFYCDVCRRTAKDSVNYLDHLNSRYRSSFLLSLSAPLSACRLTVVYVWTDLRQLGQTTRVVRSSLSDVRDKIAELRAKTAASSESKRYNLAQRIKEIKEFETLSKAEAKAAKKQKKHDLKAVAEEKVTGAQDVEMMKAMGFASFG